MTLTHAERKALRALATGKGRREQGRFLAEGVRVLEEALAAGATPERLFLIPDGLGEREQRLVAAYAARGVAAEELPRHQLEALAETRTPQPLLGVFPLRAATLAELARDWPSRLLVLDGVADPGNAGTLLRSALAFGCPAVALVGECADPHAPKVVRASAGALFALRLARGPASELAALIEAAGCVLIASTVDGSEDRAALSTALAAAARAPRLALAIGSEAAGISRELLAAARHRVRISHAPAVESLNAAVAGSILLHDLYRNGQGSTG